MFITATYVLDGISRAGSGYAPVTVQDIIIHFTSNWYMKDKAELLTMNVNFEEAWVSVLFKMSDLYSMETVTRGVAVGGIVPKIELNERYIIIVDYAEAELAVARLARAGAYVEHHPLIGQQERRVVQLSYWSPMDLTEVVKQ